MPPDSEPLFDADDIDYLSYEWCALPWSPWVPFTATRQVFQRIPDEPGLYRIRPAGKDFLMYVGETRRAVHQRLHELRIELKGADRMPWSEPHTESPGLWAWHDAEGYEYECSAAPLDASTNGRRGMEAFLLYRYRQERGESPLCNFGRFHPRYRRSTTRKENVRGGKLAEGQKDNPAGGPGLLPLTPAGVPGDRNWMGLSWSIPEPLVPEKIQGVPERQGVYIMSDAGSQEIVSIGQSMNCARRLLDNSSRSWDDSEILFSYHIPEKPVPQHQLRELEGDLIGNYYEQHRKAPVFQFRISA